MSRIAALCPVFPPNTYDQQAITEALATYVLPPGSDTQVLRRLHAVSGVEHRSLALPLEAYGVLEGFGAANDAFIRVATDLGADAVGKALELAGLTGADVDLVVAASVTGIAAPSLEARLAPRLGLRPDVKRLPIFGLGCVAGAAGLARVHDYLAGHPDDVAVLLCVELCSLTVQRDDASSTNLLASGLFGDGAVAAVLVGERRAAELGIGASLPEIVATRSRLYPDTEDVLGWDIGGSGFRIVLAASLADLVEAHLGDDVRELLAEHGLSRDDVGAWVAHSGGATVLRAAARTLDLPDEALARSWESLRTQGNLSSASVLHVLAETLEHEPPPPGSAGVLFAMGPGFCTEILLLRW
jgi:alkylresorcinol/alkylpyrone synthase